MDKQWDFFWNYQIKKMYNRYFLWQFSGRGSSTDDGVTPMGANSREDGVDWSQFGLPLALIIGLLGMLYHGSKDQRMSFTIMSLFLLTGYAIIIYLNQDDPQPRERDYSYVGSFSYVGSYIFASSIFGNRVYGHLSLYAFKLVLHLLLLLLLF